MKKQIICFLTALCSAIVITGCSDGSSSTTRSYSATNPTASPTTLPTASPTTLPTASPATPATEKLVVSSVRSVANGTNQTIPEDNIVVTGENFGIAKGNVSLYHTVLKDTAVSIVSWQDNSIKFKVPSTVVAGEKYYVEVKNAKGDVSSRTAANTLEVFAPVVPQLLALHPCADSESSPGITLMGRNFGDRGIISIKEGKNTYSPTVLSRTDSHIVIRLSGNVPTNTPLFVSVENSIVGKTSQAMIFTKVTPSEKPLITSVKQEIWIGDPPNPKFIHFLEISGSNLDGSPQLTALDQSVPQIEWTLHQIGTGLRTYITSDTIPSGHYTVSLEGADAANQASVYYDQFYNSTYGIFVGISDYQNPSNNLKNPDKDARDMNLALFPSGQANKKELLNEQATKANILQAIRDYVQAIKTGDTKANNLFVFYYSGHGSNDGTKAYICPYETTDSASMISDTELLTEIQKLPDATKKVIIFDSCHSGGFISKHPGNYRIKSLMTPASMPNFRGEGFKQLTGVANLVFLAAARSDQYSLDGGDMGNGLFTHFLLEGLGRDADKLGEAAYQPPAHGRISAENLFWYSQPKTALFSAESGENYRFDPQMIGTYVPGNLPIKGFTPLEQ